MERTSIIAGILIVFLGVALAYFGVFEKVRVRVEEHGGQAVAYKKIKSNYSESRVIMEEVGYDLTRLYGVEPKKYYGKYYENPNKAKKDQLESLVGVVVEKENWDKLKKIEFAFFIDRIEKKEYLTVEFPYRGGVSLFVGLKKVYLAFDKFCQEEGYSRNTPVIEYHDIYNGRIIYLKEIVKE